MAVLARASITLVQTVDVSSVTWYYKLQASTAAKPSKPTTLTPSGWTTEEPSYTEGSTNSLYVCVRTVYSDGTFDYSDVSLSTSYEAAKAAYNKSVIAQDLAQSATQPNLTPCFSVTPYKKGAFWKTWPTTAGYTYTYMGDGWIRVQKDNTSGTATVRADPMPVSSYAIKPNTNYTFLMEFRNNNSTGACGGTYIVQTNNCQFWGNATVKTLETTSGTGGSVNLKTQFVPGTTGVFVRRVVKTSEPTDSSYWTGTVDKMFSFTFQAYAGGAIDVEIRISIYEGEYTGPYKPYVGEDMSTAIDAAQTSANSATSLATAAQSSADGKNTNFYNLKYDDPVGIKEGDTWFVQEWEDKEYDPETETWVSPNWFEKLMPENIFPYTRTWDDPATPTIYGTSATISKNQDGTYTISGTVASGHRYFTYNLAQMGTLEDAAQSLDGRAYLPNGTYHFVLNGTNQNIRVGLYRYVIPHSSSGATAQATKTTTGDVTITVNLKDYPHNSVTIYLTKDVDINGTIAPTITRTDDRLITTAVKKWAIVNNQGTWVDAALADGAFARIDAGSIVTGSLDANLIQTGVLRTVRLEGPDMQTYWRLDTGAWQNHGTKVVTGQDHYIDDQDNPQARNYSWDVDTNVKIKDGVYEVNGTHVDNDEVTKNTTFVTFGISGEDEDHDYWDETAQGWKSEPYAYAGLELRGDEVNGKANWVDGQTDVATIRDTKYTPKMVLAPDHITLGESENVHSDTAVSTEVPRPDRNSVTVRGGYLVNPAESIEVIQNGRVDYVPDPNDDNIPKPQVVMYNAPITSHPAWEIIPGDEILHSGNMNLHAWITGNNKFHVFIPLSRPVSPSVVSFSFEADISTCYKYQGSAVWTSTKTVRNSGGNLTAEVEGFGELGIGLWLSKVTTETWSNLTNFATYNLELTNIHIIALGEEDV